MIRGEIKRRPEIARRMLPLLDVIFLLLSFFVVLPHGIKTKELVQIEELRSNQRKDRQEIQFYRWEYGDRSPQKWDFDRGFRIILNNNELYHGNKYSLQEMKSFLRNESKAGMDCVLVEVKGSTDFKTMNAFKKVLDELKIISIFIYEIH